MPISHNHKFIFVHIPKTGGTSIEQFFKLFKKNNLYEPKNNINENGVSYAPQHITAKQLKTHHLSKDHFDEYYKFAIVRNPYRRLISEYTWLRNGRYFKITGAPKDFSEWVKYYLADIDTDHKLTQYEYLYDDNGNLLVDDVFKLENINKHFPTILENINYPYKNIRLPKMNASANVTIQEFIKPDIKPFIDNMFEKDFEILNYSTKIKTH